jgi:hypothetical protein
MGANWAMGQALGQVDVWERLIQALAPVLRSTYVRPQEPRRQPSRGVTLGSENAPALLTQPGHGTAGQAMFAVCGWRSGNTDAEIPSSDFRLPGMSRHDARHCASRWLSPRLKRRRDRTRRKGQELQAPLRRARSLLRSALFHGGPKMGSAGRRKVSPPIRISLIEMRRLWAQAAVLMALVALLASQAVIAMRMNRTRLGRLLVVATGALLFVTIPTVQASAPTRNGLIAFERTSYSSSGRSCCIRIYTMRPDGTHIRHLAPNGAPGVDATYLRSTAFGPVFSPSGRTITFLGRSGVFEMSPSGGNVREILETPSIVDTPAYSPDGTTLIDTDFTDGFVFTMNADGENIVALPGTKSLIHPVFSPDGRHVLASRGGGPGRLITMLPDGSAMRPIRHSGGDQNASFSPDGRHILFEHQVSRSGPTYRYGLFEMRVNGSHVRRSGRITSSAPMEPTYSPDGQYIAFVVRRNRASYNTIWKIRSNGTRAHQLTHAGRFVDSAAPSWQPLWR